MVFKLQVIGIKKARHSSKTDLKDKFIKKKRGYIY